VCADTTRPPVPSHVDRPDLSALERWSGGVRTSRWGLVIMALVVGVGGGFGAVGFRWLIGATTWLVTGHDQFGAQGRIASTHLPWFGYWFLLLIPAVGGVLYGPLIYRFAREARGHGVPEVMIAVAENGGRIRPQVTVVKAIASAVCIGFGGSVGREGPIVQIGSSLASSLGQVVRVSESRLRILVACGAAAGISATFNAPITGVFFGFELILREFSIDAVFALILSSVMSDIIGQAFFGSGPIFNQMPHDLVLANSTNYLLVAFLGLFAALIGVGFKTVLYKTEDICDSLWKSRPEWLQPVIGGVVLGAVLLALPEMYGVGYPVMNRAVAGQYVLWFLIILVVAKMVATSLTIGIGGSGGVFAPSLFIGATFGTAFGVSAQHLFGPAAGSPTIYGVIAMGAVFAGATQAPLTSIASVLEMTGNFTLSLPVMLAVGISVGISKRLSYGTIYTTKLLRRGTDIDRPKPSSLLQVLSVTDVMQPLVVDAPRAVSTTPPDSDGVERARATPSWLDGLGEIVSSSTPQTLFGDETLEQAIRQLVLFGPATGLPVVADNRLIGWVTYHDVLRSLAQRMSQVEGQTVSASLAAEWAYPDASTQLRVPPTPLEGYRLVEIRVNRVRSDTRRVIEDVALPAGALVLAVQRGSASFVAKDATELENGDHLLCLIPTASN
jgi:chloride channel protein, CIC family